VSCVMCKLHLNLLPVSVILCFRRILFFFCRTVVDILNSGRSDRELDFKR
jgi:hypothetical protein